MVACPRVSYRRRTHYATRSNRIKFVRTPGNNLVAQKLYKKVQGPHCPWVLGHTRLAGTKAQRQIDARTTRKSKRTVTRAYGGCLTHAQLRDRIVRAFLLEEQRIVRKVLDADSKYARLKKRQQAKNKRKTDKTKQQQKKIGAVKAKVAKAKKEKQQAAGAKKPAAPAKAAKPAAPAKAAAPAKKAAAPAKSTTQKKVQKALRPTKVVAVRKNNAYTRPQFRRPHTYRTPVANKPSNRIHVVADKYDEFRVLRFPINTDMAMKKLEDNNTLTFIVDSRSNKTQIKHAMKKLYAVKTAKVNTLIRPDGTKKAYIRLAAAHDALDIANKIGIL